MNWLRGRLSSDKEIYLQMWEEMCINIKIYVESVEQTMIKNICKAVL